MHATPFKKKQLFFMSSIFFFVTSAAGVYMLLRSRDRFMGVGQIQPAYLSGVGANARHRADRQAPMHRRP